MMGKGTMQEQGRRVASIRPPLWLALVIVLLGVCLERVVAQGGGGALRATMQRVAAANGRGGQQGGVPQQMAGGGSPPPSWGSNLTPEKISAGVSRVIQAGKYLGQTVRAVVDNAGVSYTDSQGAFQFKIPSLKNSIFLEFIQSAVIAMIGSSQKLSPEQQKAMSDLVTRSVDGFNDLVSVSCAWHATISSWATDDNPTALNIAFPDAYAVYHVLYLPPMSDNTTYLIQGAFPKVRYFSYQSYDSNYDPIKSMRDYEIKPVTGQNPFATNLSNNRGETGMYQLVVTRDGNRGYVNEFGTRIPGSTDINLGKKGSFIILRLYAYDKSSSKPDSVWGGVDPPVVKVLLKGQLTKEFAANYQNKEQDGYNVWGTLPKCPASNTGFISSFISQAVAITSDGDASTNPCARYNQENNFALFKRSGKRVPFPNGDAVYLLACGQAKGGLQGDFVAVVSGILPKTPLSLFEPPLVMDAANYDTRYLSVSSVNMQEPGPVLQTVWDYDIAAFYGKRFGSQQKWKDVGQRRFRVVIAPSKDVARRCGLWSEDSLFLTSVDGQGKAVDFPGIIYRELLSKEMILGISEDPSEVDTVFKIKNQGCVKEPTNCTLPSLAARYMDDAYPLFKAYDCLGNGQARPAPAAPPQ